MARWNRHWRSLATWTTFSLIAQATSWGCTREIEVEPGPTTSEFSTDSSNATQHPSSGPDGSTDSEASQTAEDQSEQSPEQGSPDPDAIRCEASTSHECLPSAPTGWDGPFRVNQARDPKALQPCESAVESADLLYQNWKAQPATCEGCDTANVIPPACKDVQLVGLAHVDGSDPFKARNSHREIGRVAIPHQRCHFVRDLLDQLPEKPDYFQYRTRGAIHNKVHCDEPSTNKTVPSPTADTYWRVCADTQAKLRCNDARETCLTKRSEVPEPGCILGPGKTECPKSTIYKHRIETTSHFEDTRDCSACSVELQPGTASYDFECVGKIHYFDESHPQCEPDEPSEKVSALPDPARFYSVASLNRQNLYLKTADLRARYSGQCKGEGWEPIGDIHAKGHVTICCNF